MKKKTRSLDQPIGDKTIQEWDRLWEDVPGGFAVPHPELIGKAGLYRANLNGETCVIGKAAGKYPSRLAQRLAAFRTKGDGGRKHRTGKFIYEHREVLQLQVLVVGNDTAACKLTGALLRPMLALHQPRENVPPGLVASAAFG